MVPSAGNRLRQAVGWKEESAANSLGEYTGNPPTNHSARWDSCKVRAKRLWSSLSSFEWL